MEAQTIRTELTAEVAAIRSRAARIAPDQLAAELEGVRRVAKAHGLRSAITVIHLLDSALARGERGPLVDGWLAILSDAVDGDGRAHSDLYAAACSVRLAD